MGVHTSGILLARGGNRSAEIECQGNSGGCTVHDTTWLIVYV